MWGNDQKLSFFCNTAPIIICLGGRAIIERHHTLGRNSFTCIISVISWSTSALKTVTNGCCLSD